MKNDSMIRGTEFHPWVNELLVTFPVDVPAKLTVGLSLNFVELIQKTCQALSSSVWTIFVSPARLARS